MKRVEIVGSEVEGEKGDGNWVEKARRESRQLAEVGRDKGGERG